jgi:fructose-bisphosphate aldolase class II
MKELVPAAKLLKEAMVNGVAVGAFNITNMEVVQGIISAANELNRSVILQVTNSTIRYVGFRYLRAIVSAATEESDVPIALHLDHGENFETCKKCIDEGFTSVMIDASSCSFAENVERSAEVVEYAAKFAVSVEAELGTLSGTEDEISVPHSALYTNPNETAEFIKKAKVDSLAVAIGTSHGPNKGKVGSPKLSIETLKEIKKRVGDFPLVLHGSSSVYHEAVELCNKYGADIENAYGITNEDIKDAIRNGIAKINVDTDLRLAFLGAVRQTLQENKSTIDMRKYLGNAREAIKQIVIRKIGTFCV